MQYRQLGDSALQVSCLGLGGLHFGALVDESSAVNLIDRAVQLGINFIDTAPQYGHGLSQQMIGKAISGFRKNIILSTKAGLVPKETPGGYFGVETVPLSRERIRTTIEKSLKDLKTDYIDLFQVHAFDHAVPFEETFLCLEALVKEGKVRYLGCCNYDYSELKLAANIFQKKQTPGFISCQMHYNLIERRAEDDIIPACRKYNMSVLTYRSLARGILSGQYKPSQPVPVASRAATSVRVSRWLDERTLQMIEALEEFAQEYHRTAVELSLAWLLSRYQELVPLIGVRSVEQLNTCIKAVDWDLKDAMETIDHIIKEFGLTAQVQTRPETFLEK